jgi:hypothetical protein
MTDKQKVVGALKNHNNGAEVLTKAQIARFLGSRQDKDRVKRLVDNLPAYENKYYLVSDVADAYIRKLS